MSKIQHTELIILLDYNPLTGLFTRKTKVSNQQIGSVAGHTRKDGYVEIRLKSQTYLSHVLVWFYTTGVWPRNLLDHKDRNPSNNSWDNLREASHQSNGANKTYPSAGKFKGVRLVKGKYVARIKVNYKEIHLGRFLDIKNAARAYDQAAVQHFGQFALTNKSLGLI